MYQKYLPPFAAWIALTMISPLYAAEPLSLEDVSFETIQKQFQFILPGLKQEPILSSINHLEFLRQHTSKNKITHIRMQQKYAGFPVKGGYAIMHSVQPVQTFLKEDNDVFMTGKVYQGLEQDLSAPANDFVKNGMEALAFVKKDYKAENISHESVIPMVYMDEKNQAHWAYQVSFIVTYPDKIPAKPTVIVDAGTYKSFIQWNDLKTMNAFREVVKGKGFGGNDKTGQIAFDNLKLTRDKKTNTCYMENRDIKIINMNHSLFSQKTIPISFPCRLVDGSENTYWVNSDGYDRDNGGFSPIDDALYAGDVVRNMYLNWYQLDVVTDPNDSIKPLQLVLRTHYGVRFGNAFWLYNQVMLGDGADLTYPLTSLDVVTHEISHGFTEQNSNLTYSAQSGGMNEAFSDIAGQAAYFYSRGTNNWLIGEEIMRKEKADRYMDLPSKDGKSIDRADQYTPTLDPHFSSGVYNHLYYILSNKAGWDPHKAFDVMVSANVDYWTPDSTFIEGGCGLLHAANDLGYPLADVQASLDEVKIDYQTCKEVSNAGKSLNE